MPPEDRITQLEKQVQELQSVLGYIVGSDRYQFKKDLQLFDGRKIHVGNGTGTEIGTEATQKLGFWGNAPVVQFSSPTGRADTSGSSGTSMTTGHRFNGNTGTDYYSVGDIVYALKLCGILDNE